ncbi:MAG: cupin domain-containing protein [Actinomycetota bacterium]
MTDPSWAAAKGGRADHREAGRYFALDPSLAPVGHGAYVDYERDLEAVEMVPGLEFRPVVGERFMVNFVRYEPHTEAPRHAHEEEQITFVIDGEFEFDLDGDLRTMRRGTAVVVPPGVPHGARTLDSTCFEIDVFDPPRRVLLEMLRSRAEGGPEEAT